MANSLDLRRLRYFLAIADQGSISAAARVLNLAQPALSYHVAELERLSGVVLFTRSREGVSLTEGGTLLRRHARDIVGRVEAAERALATLARDQAAEPAARVRIAIISSLAETLTPLLVARTNAAMPEASLHIIEAGTREIEHKLSRGEADLAVYLVSTHGPGEMPLATEPLLYLDGGNGEQNLEPVTLAELAACPLVLPGPGNPLRDFVDTVARQHGLDLNVVLEIDGSRSRRNAVRSGIGGTVLGAHAVIGEGLEPGLVVRDIVAPRLFRPIYLGARRDLDPHLREAMSDMLRDALRDLGLSAGEGG